MGNLSLHDGEKSTAGEGRGKSSGNSPLTTGRPPFCAQPRNEKFFSGRF